MRYTPVIQTAAIVLIGRFNPAIFSSGWLLHIGAIDENAFSAADTRIIHPEIADIVLGNVSINVTSEKFEILTSHEPFIKIYDMAEIIFKNLSHTPVSKLGINLSLHFSLDSRAQQVELGRQLAPIEPWGTWGKSMESADPAKVGGLRVLVMEQSRPPDRDVGYRRVDIQPSTQVNPTSGVYMAVNDHFEITGSMADIGAITAMNLLDTHFESSLEESRSIISSLMDFASGLKN